MDMLKWLPTAIALVLFLGAAVVYLRGSRDKGTIDTLERNNKALTERVTILVGECREDHQKIEGQAQTIEVLTNTVNSSELIRTHHEQAMAGLADLRTDVNELPSKIAAAIAAAVKEVK